MNEAVENVNVEQSAKTGKKFRLFSTLRSSHTDVSNTTSSNPPIPRSITTSTTAISNLKGTISRCVKRSHPRFTRFSELPAEIRLLIWEYAFVPRVHELHPCSKPYNERMTFRSNSSRTPAIFHVCRESREIALQNYRLMSYEPRPTGSSGKGILRFYFSPELDTLFLNSLMGLFIMFMLLEDEEEYVGVGVMKGWQKVAFDAERVQLISLLAGIAGHAPQPRLKAVFPSLKDFTIAFDYSAKGKIRFRTSVWPGENGTSLEEVTPASQLGSTGDLIDLREPIWTDKLNTFLKPMQQYLDQDFKDNGQSQVPTVNIANVKRKAFLRGDIRYALRKTCTFFGMRPRGPFRRL